MTQTQTTGGCEALDVTGRVMLVTGASSGIGRSIAILAGRRGAAVAVNYRSGTERARETAGAIAGTGGRSIAVQGDVTVTEDVERMVAEVGEQLGPVDVLVNNAGGFMELHDFLSIPDALWRASLDVNLLAAVHCSRAVLPGMKERGWGRIVNMSSIVSETGGPGETAHYAAAKAGLEGLTVSLAREFAPHGVLVNAVAPGLIDTPIHDAFKERFEKLAPSYAPVGRPGTPEEIAEVVLFLASEAASYVTGQVWHVNGGRL